MKLCEEEKISREFIFKILKKKMELWASPTTGLTNFSIPFKNPFFFTYLFCSHRLKQTLSEFTFQYFFAFAKCVEKRKQIKCP